MARHQLCVIIIIIIIIILGYLYQVKIQRKASELQTAVDNCCTGFSPINQSQTTQCMLYAV